MNRVIDRVRRPWRRATTACPSSWSTIETKKRSDATRPFAQEEEAGRSGDCAGK
jgi:hypothetical protein